MAEEKDLIHGKGHKEAHGAAQQDEAASAAQAVNIGKTENTDSAAGTAEAQSTETGAQSAEIEAQSTETGAQSAKIEVQSAETGASKAAAAAESSVSAAAEAVEASGKAAAAPAKKRGRKVLWIILIVLVLLAAFRIVTAKGGGEQEEAPKAVSVKVMTAEYGDISSTVPLSGRIAPAEEAAIVPMAAGKVTSVNVKVGDYVNAGSVLFTIDNTQAATQLTQARAAYNLAAANYNNMKTLYEEGAVSKSDFDAVEVNYISAREAYNAAAKANSYYSVTTPISGYVTSLSVSVGSMAGQSMAASVADTSSLVIETTVSEYIAGYIKIGDSVDVYVSSLGDTAYKGTVTEFSPAPALGTLTYPITISLDNTNGDLVSGMFAEVKFAAEESTEVICLPADAVIMKNGKSVAVILDEDNIPHFSEVTTGIDNGEYVEILSGVEQGDTVVISGQTFVEEGKAVTVVTDGAESGKAAAGESGDGAGSTAATTNTVSTAAENGDGAESAAETMNTEKHAAE